MKQYIALRRLGGRNGQQWQAGETVELDDEHAAILLKRGFVRLVDEPPAEPTAAPTKPKRERKPAPPVESNEQLAPASEPVEENNEHGTLNSD
jgi:glutamate/tyrosine decarboxylase-like PLP-dependent enzyme